MKKDAFYFPHFCNARHDRKIKRVRKEMGLEGYGAYFMVLEVLREQQDFRYPIDDIDLLADEFGISEAKLKTIILNYDLFLIDEEGNFFSEKFICYLQPYILMKEQRSLAGKKSGEVRRNKSLNQKNNSEEMNGCSTVVQREFNENEQSKVKESKVKEMKGNESKRNEIDSLNIVSDSKIIGSENLSTKRRINIIKCADEYGIEAIHIVITNSKKSKFITENKHLYNVDWIFEPDNFVKVLDGRYNDEEKPEKVKGLYVHEEGVKDEFD